MPFLTIAVPTFNRCEDIPLLLDSFRSELAAMPDADVEVLVISNASTDGTDEVVTSFTNSIPNLRYLKNETNIGLQANLIRCLKESRGRYTWIMGDDEFLVPGAVGKVLSALRQYTDSALFIFNYSSEPAPMDERFLKQVNFQDLVTTQQTMIDFVNEKGWLWSLGNIGMIVVETARLMHIDPAPHMGSAFAQAGWYLEALHDQPLTFVNEIIFRTRIKSQTVNKERWKTDGTASSFHHVIESMDRFVEQNITPREVPFMFLNLCSNNRLPLWNLFLPSVLQQLRGGNLNINQLEWDTMLNLTSRINDPALRESMSGYLNALRRSATATFTSYENTLWLMHRFQSNLHNGIP